MSFDSYNNEKAPLNGSSRQRPMYHYLYGSTQQRQQHQLQQQQPQQHESALNTSIDSGVSTADSTGTGGVTGDMDSLVGEGLIATDTEEENSQRQQAANDLERLLVTAKAGGGGSFLPGGGRVPGFNRKERGFSGATVCFVTALVVLASLSTAFVISLFPGVSPFGPRDGGTVAPPASELSFHLTFPKVDRSDYGDPVENILVKSLFHPSLLYQGTEPHRTFYFPFPTGAFWTNLVLPPTADRGISYPIFVRPYGMAWSDELFQVSYPFAHRKEEAKAIHDYFIPDLTFSCNETVQGRHVTSFDPLSLTLQYETVNKGLWSVFLVQGSPYITMEYGSVTPSIRALSTFTSLECPPAVVGNFSSFAESANSGNETTRSLSYGVCETETEGKLKTAHGVQFILRTQEGWNWIVFTSEPISLHFDTRVRTTISAAEPFNGAFRAAIIPNQHPKSLATSSGLQRLINHAGIYPIHGEVSWIFGSSMKAASPKNASRIGTYNEDADDNRAKASGSQRVATMSVKFKTRRFVPQSSATAPKPLLMLALPHQAVRLAPGVQLSAEGFDLIFNTIKGKMTPVVGTAWTWEQPLLSPGFDNDRGSSGKKLYLEPSVSSLLIETLKEDINLALPTRTENIYGFGKQVARLAQLAHIADRLAFDKTSGNVTTGNATHANKDILSLRAQAVKRLRSALEALLKGNVSDTLVYDANLGGMVTTDGLRDTGADFGNGRYNDHHFHYGYILYASAILGRLESSFVSAFSSEVDALFFDVAHNANFDSRRRGEGVFFPAARYMNWFDGHSFASGLFPFGNGKSQESSSEAVNCYYGAYLWSIVRNGAGDDPDSDVSVQTDFSRLLLSLEINGAQTYWHMLPSDFKASPNRPKIYSDVFVENYMVGNVGMNDAICSTWFGTEALYVHMINFLPVTSAAGELFSREYASAEYRASLASLGEVEMAWRGFVVADHAISNPNRAWTEAQELFSPTLDAGLSKTQVLYWISMRKGFVVPTTEEGRPSASPLSMQPVPQQDGKQSSTSGRCEQNDRCAAMLLKGYCCPTSTGKMLDCC